jgi:hypothetical protein
LVAIIGGVPSSVNYKRSIAACDGDVVGFDVQLCSARIYSNGDSGSTDVRRVRCSASNCDVLRSSDSRRFSFSGSYFLENWGRRISTLVNDGPSTKNGGSALVARTVGWCRVISESRNSDTLAVVRSSNNSVSRNIGIAFDSDILDLGGIDDRSNCIIGNDGLDVVVVSSASIGGSPLNGESGWARASRRNLSYSGDYISARINSLERRILDTVNTLDRWKGLWWISNELRNIFIDGNGLNSSGGISGTISRSPCTGDRRRTIVGGRSDAIGVFDVDWISVCVAVVGGGSCSSSVYSGDSVETARDGTILRNTQDRSGSVVDCDNLNLADGIAALVTRSPVSEDLATVGTYGSDNRIFVSRNCDIVFRTDRSSAASSSGDRLGLN